MAWFEVFHTIPTARTASAKRGGQLSNRFETKANSFNPLVLACCRVWSHACCVLATGKNLVFGRRSLSIVTLILPIAFSVFMPAHDGSSCFVVCAQVCKSLCSQCTLFQMCRLLHPSDRKVLELRRERGGMHCRRRFLCCARVLTLVGSNSQA